MYLTMYSVFVMICYVARHCGVRVRFSHLVKISEYLYRRSNRNWKEWHPWCANWTSLISLFSLKAKKKKKVQFLRQQKYTHHIFRLIYIQAEKKISGLFSHTVVFVSSWGPVQEHCVCLECLDWSRNIHVKNTQKLSVSCNDECPDS